MMLLHRAAVGLLSCAMCVWHARGRVVWVKKDMRASATMVIEVLLENTFCEDTF